jgi:dGTPase
MAQVGISIRERYQEYERRRLCAKAALSCNTRGRLKPETECSIRTPYQRDRDRIIHTKSFRRLKRKTQVFICPLGDHYRTRLTHTLEVSQIARTIARALDLNEDLVEAIGMGHDLGHTPFGHAGEAILNQLLKDGFRHYLQSLRVVDVLERNGQGLNLTWEVRDGILKHSKGMGPIFSPNPDRIPATLEGQIVRVSDIIAYVNHDLDDAVRSGLILPAEVPQSALEVLGESHSCRINSLVTDVIGTSEQNGLEMIRMSDERLEAMMALRAFLNDRVYRHPGTQIEFQKARKILTDLYEYLLQNPDRFLPVEMLARDPIERVAADFLAGMTDTYAIQLYTDLFVPREWMSVDRL